MRFIDRVRARVARSRRQTISGRDLGETVDIGRLICPLRYDLCVRIDFIRLLQTKWTLYTEDLSHFLERPESRAYYTWFKEIACARFQPEIYGNEALVRSGFVQRVHETAKLWRSIADKGYDPSTPIRLRAGRSVRSVNNKKVDSAYFAGDGCHRLSCLVVMGQTHLRPEQYEVVIEPEYHPLDNTAPLIRHLPLYQSTYLRFISRFYCDGRQLDSVEEILRQVASAKSFLLPELESVLAFDLPSLSKP